MPWRCSREMVTRERQGWGPGTGRDALPAPRVPLPTHLRRELQLKRVHGFPIGEAHPVNLNRPSASFENDKLH